MSLERQLRAILQVSDEVDISCPEVDLHDDALHIEWHAAKRWVMTFAILGDYVAYAVMLGDKRDHGRWELNESVPEAVKALMYEYRDFEDAQMVPPQKSGPERAEAFRVMVQQWRDESPEGNDEEIMAVLRREMPYKFKEPLHE